MNGRRRKLRRPFFVTSLDSRGKQGQILVMRALIAFVLACVLPLSAGFAAAEDARKLNIGGREFVQSEIVDARAQPRLDGKSGIIMTLEPAAIARLAGVIAANATTPIRILLDGKLIAEPIIERAPDGDWVELRGEFTLEQAVGLARLISGKEPLPESLDEGP
jgi:preprotein translocase subunit SecD